ncbi:MAG: hypothetical protein AAFY19_04165, partial [Pseudomonadota bacterium]
MRAELASLIRLPVFAAFALLMSGCASVPEAAPEVRPPVAPPPSTSETPAPLAPDNAALAGLTRGPSVASLPISSRDAASALSAFVLSCPQLLTRTDVSGVGAAAGWRPACDAASGWQASEARDFFAQYFETARIGDGKAFATGYLEPEILGSRDRR